MNDFLRQLASISPAIGAGVGGNGEAMQAFMEGYQRTMAQLEMHKRAQSRDQLDQQELQMRQQAMTQQAERQKATDARAAEVDTQQDFIRGQQAQDGLIESASMFDDPTQAKGYIESMMPNLMQAFGQGSMALGQPAVEMATQVITGRQKTQVEAYLKKWAESTHAQTFINNGVPAEKIQLTELPEHIARYLGKPSATLAEVQAFASLPVGTPAKATRGNPTEASIAMEAAGGDAGKAFEMLNPQPKPAAGGGTAEPKKQEWVIRGGQITPIQPGTAQPGDRPYNETTQRQGDQAAKRDESVITAAEDALSLVQKLKTEPGMSGAVGAKGPSSLFGLLEAPMAGTNAATYAQFVDSLKSKLTIPAMQQMRGLGAMSDREFRTMSDSVTALHRNMREGAFRKELGNIERTLQNVIQKLQVATSAPGMNRVGNVNGVRVGQFVVREKG